SLEWRGKNGRELGRLLPPDVACRGSKVKASGSLRPIHAGAPLDQVQIELQNAPLPENEFGNWYQRGLGAFAKEGASCAEEQVLHQLLGEGGSSAGALAFHVFFGGDVHLVPVETVMLVEARIFPRDYRVLKFRRDLAERNEFKALLIGLAMDPSLPPSLHLHGSRRRVDPAGGKKQECGDRPKGQHTDGEPQNEGAERRFAKRGKDGCFRPGNHV